MSLPWLSDPRRPLTSPREIPKLEAWFDALDTRTMLSGDGSTITDGGSVALWGDKSGNSGVNCLVLPGASGNYASVPDAGSPSVDITGDIDLRCRVAMNDWTPAADVSLIGKWGAAGQRSYSFYVSATTGTLGFAWTSNGTGVTFKVSTEAPVVSDFSPLYVRVAFDVDNGAGGNDVKFYTSSDGVTWTQLGTTVTTASTASIFNSTQVVEIGSQAAGTAALFSGRIYNAQIYASTNGTDQRLDIDFSLAGKKLANGDTFTCATGQTVTLNSSGATGARIAGERDLFQGTLANRPVYLNYAGTKYGWLNGTAGNGFSTPNAAGSTLTGDLSFVTKVRLDSVAPSGYYVFGSQQPAPGQYNWEFYLGNLASGTLRFNYSTDGTAIVAKTASVTLASVGVAAATDIYLGVYHDVDNGASGNDVKFFWSLDGTSWTQIGATQTTAGTVTRHASTGQITVGCAAVSGLTNPVSGRVYSATLHSGDYFTSPVASVLYFNPALYTIGTTVTASTGEVWTINGGAHIVTRTGLYSDGSNDYLKTAAFSLSQPESVYLVGSQVSWTTGEIIFDGNSVDSMDLIQTTNGGGASPRVRLYAGAYACNVDDWSLKTAAAMSSVFNGASSSLRKNRGTATTGDPGAANANGFNLGCGSTPGGYSNVFVSEVAIYSAAHATATQDRMTLYAGRKWGFSV